MSRFAEPLLLTHLKLPDADGIRSLEPLRGMPLMHIQIQGASKITSLEPLKGMDPDIVNGASEKLLETMR